jgi:beta-glucosidase
MPVHPPVRSRLVIGAVLAIDLVDRAAVWLPGSEGEGVADTMFGRRSYTGKLPMTWPRTLAQEPINVGDDDYDPLYPYGWGLRTR